MNMLNYKRFLIVLIFGVFLFHEISAQDNVGIGTTSPNASSILELSATDKGLLVPRLTTAQRNLIGTPATGLIIFNTESGTFEYYSGTSWIQLFSGSFFNLDNGKIFVGDINGDAAQVTMSGDATLSNTGVLTIGDDKITTAKILDGNVTTAKIADNAITTAKILDANVTTSKLADNSVDGTKINLSGNANGDLMYYNGTDWARLAPGTSGYVLQTNGAGNAPTWAASSLTLDNGEIFVGNSSNAPTSVPMSGDASIDNTGLLTIANGAVTDAKLGTGINANKIANGTVDNTEFQYLNGVTSDIQTQLDTKLSSALTENYVFVGNSSNQATGVPVTGNISYGTLTGFTIQANAITNAMVSPLAGIYVSKLGAGTSGQIIRTNGTAVEWWTPNYLESGATAGGDLTGTYPNPTVDALQGRSVYNVAPVDGQVLTWNNTDSRWEPQTPSSSSGWALAGNSLAGTEILGSTNAQPLSIVTNNTERMRIWDDGQIGINRSTTFDDSIKVWLSGDMLIDGDLIVTGTIDPLAIQLIPQNTPPVSASTPGFMYYDSTAQTIKITNGTTWSDLGSNLTNGLNLKNSDNTAKELKFYEPSASGSNYTAFKAQAQDANVTYTLPIDDGTDGQVLTTDGSGGLTWETPTTPTQSITVLNSSTTLNSSHEIVLLTGSDFTVTLPSASGITGKTYIIKANRGGDNIYTIQAASGQLIDDSSSKQLRTTNGLILRGFTIISDGSNWQIISTVYY